MYNIVEFRDGVEMGGYRWGPGGIMGAIYGPKHEKLI